MELLKIKNKKASIASGIAMIPAIILILFILIIYFVFIGIMLPDRKTNEVQKQGLSTLSATNQIVYILASPVGNNDIYGLIENWRDSSSSKDKELLRKSLEEILDSQKFSCSMLQIGFGGTGETLTVNQLAGLGSVANSPVHQKYFLDKGTNFILYSGSELKTEIKFYQGSCELEAS